MDKIKLKEKLDKRLNRTATVDEVENATSDIGLILEQLLEDFDDLEKRVKKLENK